MAMNTGCRVANEARPTVVRNLLLLSVAFAVTTLTGCAGNPPNAELAVAQSAVQSAVSAGGTEYSPVAMKSSQDKLKSAQLATQNEEYERARMLAEQAEWDARLAERQAMAVKANKALQDSRQGARDLRDEGLRQIPLIAPQ